MISPITLVATWKDGVFALAGNGLSHELANTSVRGLTADGRGGALAIVSGGSIARRAAGGNWEKLISCDFELSCCLMVGETIWAGTEDARILRWSEGSEALETVESFDRTPGRNAWFAGSAVVNGQRVGPPLAIRSLAANTAGTIFANVHVGGIPLSDDNGRSWRPTVDISIDVHEVCTDRQHPDIVVAAAAGGLCISRDGGRNWTTEREGLDELQCYAVAISGDNILVSAAQSPFSAEGRIYRRPVAPSGSLELVKGGMPAWTGGMVDTACIATNKAAVAVADKSGDLYTSSDFGQSWLKDELGLPTPSSVLLC